MKKLLLNCLLLSIFAVLNSACSKQDDDADAFVGYYTTSATVTSTWAGTTHTSALSGNMTITKVSANRVKTSGWMSTYGEVVGNAIYLESYPYSESDYTTTTVFGPGFLNGNVLTFSCTESGKILSSGTWYPYY